MRLSPLVLLLFLLTASSRSSASRIWAWGNNQYGQCDVPESVTNAVAISAGWTHCLALRPNGTVVAWGDNRSGQCNVPAGLTNVVAISGGSGISLALKDNGTVVAWGASGQTNVPSGLSNVIAISAGFQFSLALKANGTVVGWGNNGSGQCRVPADLTNAIGVVAGSLGGLALTSEGTVRFWGDCGAFECWAPGATNLTYLSPRGAIVVGIRGDGTALLGWGTDNQGILSKAPTDLTNCVAGASGAGFALVLRANGEITSWGLNNYGQTNVPAGLTNAVAISAGEDFVLALGNLMPPRFISTPLGRNVTVGSDVRLVARVEGSPEIFYQWYFEDTPLTGATGTTLELATIQAVQSGTYTLVASNAQGVATSGPIVVRVLPLLDIQLVPSILIKGGVGLTYRVEYMNSMGSEENWLPLATLTLTNNPQHYPDYSAIGQPKRVYRVQQLP